MQEYHSTMVVCEVPTQCRTAIGSRTRAHTELTECPYKHTSTAKPTIRKGVLKPLNKDVLGPTVATRLNLSEFDR